MPDEQNIYYHYTSVEALYNIVKTRTFWLVNSKSSNDKTEGVFTEAEFNRIIKLAREKISEENKKYFDEIFAQNISVSDFFKIENEYILCLSKISDSLAHWDRYANFRKGICIYININKLNKYFNSLNQNYFNAYELGYTDDELISEVINGFDFYSKVREFHKMVGSNEFTKNSFLKNTFLEAVYSLLCSKKKNPYFKDEKEMRINFLSWKILNWRETIQKMNTSEELKSKHLSTLKKLDIEKTYFEPIHGEIRSLHHMCLKDIWDSDLIPEIMLGPNCPQSKDELRAFLDENGLTDTKITESEIPIR